MVKKLKMGMVGGGKGAFIGPVHRIAAILDGEIELVCGAFSGDPEVSKASGLEIGLPENRCYSDYKEMVETESKLPPDTRMDFVSIVTPNHMHFAPAKLAMENGFPVVCDKPLCYNLEEAYEFERIVKDSGLLFALTHNYTGYPLVKQARQLVKKGMIGDIRKIVVEYPQGWLSTKLEDTDLKQAGWRTDPKRSGIAGAMGDIGTHAENLAEYISGLKIKELCADLTTFVPGRKLEDDGSILLRFENGAKGILFASQIAAGEENNLNIRVYGSKGGLQWFQEEPNSLYVKWLDKPMEVYKAGNGYLFPETQAHTRLLFGHPEGYLEAFANIYRNFAKCLKARLSGTDPDPIYMDFPTVSDGVRGMEFIYKVVESSGSDKKWISF